MMATPAIHIVTEGATERVVGKMLYDDPPEGRNLLSHAASPRPRDWKSLYGRSREGYGQVIEALREDENLVQAGGRLLLMFDQEDSPSPRARANEIRQDLSQGNPASIWSTVSWKQVGKLKNVFEYRLDGLHIVLHVANAVAPMAEELSTLISNRDFDGYILQLLQGQHREAIAQRLVPGGQNPTELLRKAEREITQLMQGNKFPWQRNKSWVYAYITTFQFRQSHVWFARDVVKAAPRDALKEVFAPLISAWNLLAEGGN